ncbi:MAG: hypothetical protein A3E78_05220 [Alphaproteobacteria bacterium RIFCSPHIGHO2_12_FULL_63_12]|nr:MAG: hypothetical protein A3E78_05220 [Alphaproteobacteria bacterium RIFCSPHIGHO2_12_FULL_63_12]
MLDAIRKIFSGPGNNRVDDAAREMPIAIAALLVEAAVADDNYADTEKALIQRLLVEDFAVAATDVAAVMAAAEQRQKDSVDLYRFVRVVKTLPPAGKIKLVESLWRVILSDGERQSDEDALVRRVCGLINVEDIDSGLARQRVQKELEA